MLIDGGIHKLHFMRYIGGEPETVFSPPLPRGMGGMENEGEDGAVVHLSWPHGRGGVGGAYVECRPAGSTGSAGFGDGGSHFLRGRVAYFDCWNTRGRQCAINLPPDGNGIPAMVKEFAECIRVGREPETSGLEGLRDLALVLAAYRSMRSGRLEPVPNL